jgi:hypothetical protein
VHCLGGGGGSYIYLWKEGGAPYFGGQRQFLLGSQTVKISYLRRHPYELRHHPNELRCRRREKIAYICSTMMACCVIKKTSHLSWSEKGFSSTVTSISIFYILWYNFITCVHQYPLFCTYPLLSFYHLCVSRQVSWNSNCPAGSVRIPTDPAGQLIPPPPPCLLYVQGSTEIKPVLESD